jgi:hypothetical protein
MWHRRGTIALAAFLVLPYTVLVLLARILFTSGNGLGIGLGIGVVVLMGLGVWSVAANLRFGFQIDGLSRRMAEQDLLPDLTMLPRRPSGRVEPAAADAWFDERKAELDADPTNWRCWYTVAIAYDIAGDRSRARDTMRQAIRLSARSGDGSPATSA